MFPCCSSLNMKVIWLNMVSDAHSLTMGWLDLKFAKFVAGETSMGGVENIWGSNIYYYINALLLFHFFRISQHPEKWSVSFKNFVRKCQCISCYLPISSNLQFQLKKVIFRNSLLVYLSIILTTNSKTPFVKNNSSSCVSSF